MQGRLDEDSELLIDSLRGIAALAVLLTHAVDISIAGLFGWDLAATPEGWRWARATVGHGGYWVWCFFVISGLCIHQSIARSVAHQTFDWQHYALARVTRLYPLFLIGLALALVAWAVTEGWSGGFKSVPWPQIGASAVMMQIFTTTVPTYQTSWSLSNEMAYYLIWPVSLWLAGRNGSRAFAWSIGTMLAVVGGIFVLWKYFHKLETSCFVGGVWAVAVLYPVWAVGAWLAMNWEAVRAQVTRRLWMASILLCIVSEALLAVMKFKNFPGWAVHLAGWSSIPGLMIFLAGARHARIAAHAAWKPVARWLGQLSYPCYALHLQLLVLLDYFAFAGRSNAITRQPMLRAVLLLAPVLVFLALVGPFLERHFMVWRSRLVANTRVPAPVPG